MKKLMMMVSAILLCCIMALPVIAGGQGEQKSGSQSQSAGHDQNAKPESEGRQLHKAHFKTLEERMNKRDAAMEKRQQMIESNDPGKTGF
jgi:uncharacterized protein HemX